MEDGALGAALRRLELATGAIEAASALVADVRELARDKDQEVALLAEDRARLAQEMDEIHARADRLETSNRDVARRLDTAIETIRGVLSDGKV
ncbi:DUF4164 family protein [Terrihabitans sp. B22-R8]|uniref:DUF4164 family protein n=1 Tax=Terrihabitans sp. B22-R8 TaxID=3425128 RepID=UPI00403CE395